MYYQVTDDIEFMVNYGLEMLIELARVLLELGHYYRNGQFCINEVTGPDEYTGCVNNNYYGTE